MRSLRFAIAAASLIASAAFASPTAPVNGAEYLTLAQPQPVQTAGKKVEVIEFFMYHCPACNALEPSLAAWVKKQGNNIEFKRVHMPMQGLADPEAHLYLTLEAMGKLEEMHPKVFRAFHVERQRLNRDDAIIEWVAKNGVDKAKFLEYWNSFGVQSKLRRIPQVLSNYKVDSVPTLVIDGRYMTSPSMVGQAAKGNMAGTVQAATMQVADALVAKVQKDKGLKPAAAK
ncbi:thiol:disulfide interchange protein DsbA/DsbL [Massilia cavernae]|uniref:Thiol:disulfide interchange protein n=1 Tax=Massilia cavernae TaxID=2320864 RepID=A0A418XRG4_9BURK|nr:thiol:disulfide interchange protein DsbA/DsbL [Massilia cavernae]RJG15109.1 thiol:disulfide interchange protein DsbA/DsbL [Massilia cavernae]